MDDAIEPLLGDPVKPGNRLGSNYVVGERLGRGAMGVVHEAVANDGRRLAVKFLRPELATDHKTVGRFLQERHIFRTVKHPNVVRVHDLVAEGDDLAIVMERVSGGDLKQRIADGSLTPRQSIEIASGIAAGLTAIHRASVVHRDLKPANILLTDELAPKISDFGISRLVTETMTRTSTTIGTPIYMAPEAADQRGADAPADVYALGIIVFELLTGRPPFAEGGTFAVLRAHAMDVPPRVDGIPAELAELIARMLDKEPTARPGIVEVRDILAAVGPRMDDTVRPVAIAPVAGAGWGFDSQETTGPRASGDPTVVGGGVELADTNPPTGPGSADSTMVAGSARSDDDPTAVSPGLGVGAGAGPAGPTPGPRGGLPGAAGIGSARAVLPGADSGAEGVPFVAGPAGARTTGGRRSLLPNQVSRRVAEVVVAVGSLTAVLVVVAFILNAGSDGGSEITSEGSSTAEPFSPATNPIDGSSDGDDGPTQFSSSQVDGDAVDGDAADPAVGDDGDPAARSTTTTRDDGSTTATTDDGGPTPTDGGPTTTADTGSRVSTATSSTTTRPSSTATTPTTPTSSSTSSTSTSSSTTSTTAVVAVPISIVAGPTVNVVNPRSFQFSYRTNDVCGTGSFTVTEAASGAIVGTFTGRDVCFGPEHGGFPGFQGAAEFRNFDLEPGTEYRVSIAVRGTSPGPGESRPPGSGVATDTFRVTTASA